MIIREMIEARKKSIEKRLDPRRTLVGFGSSTMTASNIKYEIAERTRAITYGGIGLIHKLARESGLIDAIDEKLSLLKLYLPYRESDHVLNIAYNALCEGRCLEDIELRRNDEAFLDALGAERIPDPTTAGDFLRRFRAPFDIGRLNDAIDEARLNVWERQPERFFDQATIDMDGHVLETSGQCKKGMDIAYNGKWGYHPLILSLAETGEVLTIKNRPGNRPSEEGAPPMVERCIGLCRRAGFRRIVLRGDTKFSQTQHLDRWDDDEIRFYFGYVAKAKLTRIADDLKNSDWSKLQRPAKYKAKTKRRRRPENVKEEVVKERAYENKILQYEEVAEFRYQPRACHKSYRMIVVRKHIRVEKRQRFLFDSSPYLFYITNDWDSPVSDIVFTCNGRCNQENLIEQLINGVRAMHAPVDNLISNWAYMVIIALAWNLKAWSALWLPEKGRWASKHRAQKYELLKMEFRKFTNVMMKIPCQIVRTGRQIVYRLLSWNPWQSVFFRLVNELHC